MGTEELGTERTVDRPRDMAMLDVVRLQRAACARAGSLVYAQILDGVADDVERGGPCAALLAPWTDNALADAIPLRLLAGVHRIVLEGRASALARHYPSAGGTDDDDPTPAFMAAVSEHAEELARSMHLGVQTNEVGRACSLLGGFHAAASATGLPLRILEVGASAGLLLRWDHYRYETGDWAWGPEGSLTFTDPWAGAPPETAADLVVAERAGCDINPIDPTSPEGITDLRAFLWPDQVHRRRRLDEALAVAARTPGPVVRADAADWIEAQLARPSLGTATVVYHSIVLQYLPRSTFQRMRNLLRAAGERADRDAPLFWLRMEPAGEFADLRMRAWPGGHDLLLGTTDYHGPPVHWTG